MYELETRIEEIQLTSRRLAEGLLLDAVEQRFEGRFLDWLVRRGRSRQSARNVKFLAGKARHLLGGKTFAVPALELAALETLPEFQVMKRNPQSDLRQALRLLSEYQAEGHQRRKRPRQTAVQPIEEPRKAA